jgi:epoxyqueuosine reductase
MQTKASNMLKNTNLVKQLAANAGFSFCGISKAEFLEEDAPRLETWLKSGFHGSMQWMENHFDKRLDPRLLVPGAKSVISLMYNYYTPLKQDDTEAPKISKYAFGDDYHAVIKDKLFNLVEQLSSEIGEIDGRVFVDSAPVLERTWAAKSGLGWIGKNTMLISKQAGSFYFLAQIISDLELVVDQPIKDFCGTCTACIDACPTEAILPNGVIDSNRCISYLTIELRDEIPQTYKNQMDNWAFGCDVCQDVCPWNRFSKPHQEPLFGPNPELLALKSEAWFDITDSTFNQLFKNSAVKRTKFKGLKRNLEFLKPEN